MALVVRPLLRYNTIIVSVSAANDVTQLETIASIPEADRDAIETLAVKVFVKHSPADPATLADPYVKCLSLGKPYKACLVTGR